jgi:hypothetical protein
LKLHAFKVEVRHVKSSAPVSGSPIVDVEAQVLDEIFYTLVTSSLGEAVQEQVLSGPNRKVTALNFSSWEQLTECFHIVKDGGILAGAAAADQEV